MLRRTATTKARRKHLRKVLAQYPRDRVAVNDLGRVLFLQRKYADAVKVLQQVLAIDPEDLQAHYNLMLCYNGLGDEKMAKEHQVRYLRFKADESAQAITGPYRQLESRRQQRAADDSRARVGAAPVGSAKDRGHDQNLSGKTPRTGTRPRGRRFGGGPLMRARRGEFTTESRRHRETPI